MGALLGIYILLWGLGLALDPRLADYKMAGVIGMGLLMGGWALVELRTTFPLELVEKEVNRRFSLKLIALVCVIAGIAASLFFHLSTESR